MNDGELSTFIFHLSTFNFHFFILLNHKPMNLYFDGLLIGAATFLTIGVFHPIVIKAEYHLGVKCWWVFLFAGIAAAIASLFVCSSIISTLLGVFAFSSFWSIHEIFQQRERVRKGWFPKNPKRKS